jgi:UDPglucose 6-dehydrogenase
LKRVGQEIEMHIGVYGSGYIATIVSACLADFGVPVMCVDDDAARILALSKGETPYFEKNLQELMRRNIRSGRLMFSTEISSLARNKQIIFLATDSPAYIEEIALRIARVCAEPVVLSICTPVPVGTADSVERRINATAPHITVVSHPLFLTDGCAVEDFNWPDRILLGTKSAEAVNQFKQLYRPLVMRGVPVIVTSFTTAELVREASTAFAATKQSFINEIAQLCEHVEADAIDLSLALGLDKKIAPRCLQPGNGFGGPFFEHEMDSLAQLAYSKGVSLRILSAAREVNSNLTDKIVNKMSQALASLNGKQVGVLGLAFKPHTNSVASSAAMAMVKKLVERGARVRAFDPAAMTDAKSELSSAVELCKDAYSVSEAADALVIGTGWPEFKALDFPRIKRTIKRPLIIDPRNMLDASRMKGLGFEYMGLGRVN